MDGCLDGRGRSMKWGASIRPPRATPGSTGIPQAAVNPSGFRQATPGYHEAVGAQSTLGHHKAVGAQWSATPAGSHFRVRPDGPLLSSASGGGPPPGVTEALARLGVVTLAVPVSGAQPRLFRHPRCQEAPRRRRKR